MKFQAPYHLTNSGQNIKFLFLCSPLCSIATVASLVLSFQNLEDFILTGTVWKKPLLDLSYTPQRKQLASLQLYASDGGVGATLAQCECGLTSRRLSLAIYKPGLEQLLALSSQLCGVYSSRTPRQQERYDTSHRSVSYPKSITSCRLSTTTTCPYHYENFALFG